MIDKVLRLLGERPAISSLSLTLVRPLSCLLIVVHWPQMGKELVLERLIETTSRLVKLVPTTASKSPCQEQFSTYPVEVVMLGEGIECICRLDLAVRFS